MVLLTTTSKLITSNSASLSQKLQPFRNVMSKGAPRSVKNPRPRVDFRCRLGWEIDFWRFKGGRTKFEQNFGSLIFSKKKKKKKTFFFRNFLDFFWSNHLETCAWNTKLCISRSNLILLPWNHRKSISKPTFKSTSRGLFFFCDLWYYDSYESYYYYEFGLFGYGRHVISNFGNNEISDFLTHKRAIFVTLLGH